MCVYIVKGFGFFQCVSDIRCLCSAVSNFASNSKACQGTLLTQADFSGILKISPLLPQISTVKISHLPLYMQLSITRGKITPCTNLSTSPGHRHPWREHSALICMIQTLDTCNKHYFFSRTNLARYILMVAFILYSTYLRVLASRAKLYFPSVLAGHHCNHLSGTICFKWPRELIIYQKQNRHFGEGCNYMCAVCNTLESNGTFCIIQSHSGKGREEAGFPKRNGLKLSNLSQMIFLLPPLSFWFSLK